MSQISFQQFVVYHRNMSLGTVPEGQNYSSKSHISMAKKGGIVNMFKYFLKIKQRKSEQRLSTLKTNIVFHLKCH